MKYLQFFMAYVVAQFFASSDEATLRGEALGKELQSAWGDTAALGNQANMLKDIFNETQYQAFIQAYQPQLSCTPITTTST